ncbi:MAG: Spy/CpxP family protein refolding chaperone [Cellvibrio sp.]|uniref:Spy/CpxP family protein refolding chaperone n=1 Tax=Cellvibrio sp. TaxID=1965322 RepID=UPI00319F1042
MKSNKFLATGILLLSIASIAMPTLAGDGKGRDGRHHAWAGQEGFGGGDFRHVGKALDLTDAQKETLKAQRESDKAAREALHAKLFEAREALTTAVNSGANDAEISVLADALGKLHAEQALAGAKAQKAFLAVLTAEQKQTLAELKAKRQDRKGERKAARESAQS